MLGFCRQRAIPAEGIQLLQRLETDPASGMIRKVSLDIRLPVGFPEKYRPALVRAAEQCAVKKHLDHPPQFVVAAN